VVALLPKDVPNSDPGNAHHRCSAASPTGKKIIDSIRHPYAEGSQQLPKDVFMSVTVTLLFPTKAEESDNFYNALVSVLHETRAYDGCISVSTHRDLDDASKVLLIEEWETREHQLSYLRWRGETGLLEAIGPMLAGEPVITAYSNSQD
jgi:quinol monooxygenase YgiN